MMPIDSSRPDDSSEQILALVRSLVQTDENILQLLNNISVVLTKNAAEPNQAIISRLDALHRQLGDVTANQTRSTPTMRRARTCAPLFYRFSSGAWDEVIRRILPDLTQTRRSYLAHYLAGRSDAEIAVQVARSRRAVSSTLTATYLDLGLESRHQLLLYLMAEYVRFYYHESPTG